MSSFHASNALSSQLGAAAAASGQERVMGALIQAARATGVSFDYLLQTARRESSLDPVAQARTSSAAGLFQFIDQTWLGMVARHGAAHGLEAESAAISRRADGRYEIADPAKEEAILALRLDPDIASAMAGEYARESAERLEAGLGRRPSDGDLYAAHFLGAGGALSMIRAAEETPDAHAAALFPAAARANRAIFYDPGGAARTVAQVMDNLVSRHGASPSGLSGPTGPAHGDPDAPGLVQEGPVHGGPGSVPATTRLAGGALSSPVQNGSWSTGSARGYLLSADMIAAMAVLDPLEAISLKATSPDTPTMKVAPRQA